ncbi:hypothetical protein LCGC14_2294880 [marine sediment metagenome]|uniref:Uncharacterized protein n=1 Tax=marine sediment metagenome TaxID=412755 RepID=A0A0F9CQN4_9ZZZZ
MKQTRTLIDKYLCDFCKRETKKAFVDTDRLICNNCLKTYLGTLRWKLLVLSEDLRAALVEHSKMVDSLEARYHSLCTHPKKKKARSRPLGTQEAKNLFIESIGEQQKVPINAIENFIGEA